MTDDKVLPGYFEGTNRSLEIVGLHSAGWESVLRGSCSYSERIRAYLYRRHRQQLERGLGRAVLLQCRWAARHIVRCFGNIAFWGDLEECGDNLSIEKRQKH